MVRTHVLCTPAGEKSLIQLEASPVCVPRVFGLRSAAVDFFLSLISARIPWHAERNLLELFAIEGRSGFYGLCWAYIDMYGLIKRGATTMWFITRERIVL